MLKDLLKNGLCSIVSEHNQAHRPRTSVENVARDAISGIPAGSSLNCAAEAGEALGRAYADSMSSCFDTQYESYTSSGNVDPFTAADLAFDTCNDMP